jgi:hypothetical protein
MVRSVRRTIIVLSGIVAGVVVLLCGGVFLLNTSYVQNRLLRHATKLLTEKLNTQVRVDSVSLSLFSQELTLYGVRIDDQHQHPLLSVRQVSVNLVLSKLLHREVIIEEAGMTGLDARLISKNKSEDGVANYQFLIDAFKKDSTQHPTPNAKDADSIRKKGMQFDVNHLHLKDIHVRYNDVELTLGEADYAGEQLGIERLRVLTDNHLPRKNANRPHRGFFDAGHLDVTTNMQWTIHSLKKDSLSCTLTDCRATDSVTGINLTDLRFSVEANKERALVSDIVVQQTSTVLHIPRATVDYPLTVSPKRAVTYHADSISGTTLLKDISRPFAPVLSGFTIPLNLSLSLSGTDSTMTFNHVKVSTQDRQLTIAANGHIDHLKDSKQLAVRFNVGRMNAKKGVAEKVISQFQVKKYMMKQLHRLGDISYSGRFAVLWKKEEFQGKLQTAGGPIDFRFALDEQNKYVNGTVSSPNFLVGDVMEMEHIGPVACRANFRFDYSKPRTARMRKEKGGKLPMGNVNAIVDDCSYRKIHLRNVSVDMMSDGAEVTGDVKQEGKYRDLSCHFSFTDTDDMRKMKITNPGIKFHKARRDKK